MRWDTLRGLLVSAVRMVHRPPSQLRLLFPGRRLCLTCVFAVADTWACPGDAQALQLLILMSQSNGATLVPATARSYHCLEPSWSHVLREAG